MMGLCCRLAAYILKYKAAGEGKMKRTRELGEGAAPAQFLMQYGKLRAQNVQKAKFERQMLDVAGIREQEHTCLASEKCEKFVLILQKMKRR